MTPKEETLMQKKFSLGLLTLAVIASPMLLENSCAQDGGLPGAYLRIGAGVRGMGTGGAFVAVANDVSAGYWNPAGLGAMTVPEIGGMYSLLSLDRQYNYAAGAYPLGSFGTFGVSWINFNVGNLTAYNQAGNALGEFSNSENAVLFSYGKKVASNFALGGSAKMLFHSLAGSSASGMGFDLGARFMPTERFVLGASVQNLAASLKWNTTAATQSKFPTLARMGVLFRPLNMINFAADYELINGQSGKWHVGWEVFMSEYLNLRAGNDNGSIALGASLVNIAAVNNTLELDYGFSKDPIDQSATHRFAFLLRFRPPAYAPLPNTVIGAQKVKPLKKQPAPKFAPGRRVSNQNDTYFKASVVELRPNYWIITLGGNQGLEQGMKLELFQALPENETGRAYGLAEAFEVRQRHAIIKILEPRDQKPVIGENILLKVWNVHAEN